MNEGVSDESELELFATQYSEVLRYRRTVFSLIMRIVLRTQLDLA